MILEYTSAFLKPFGWASIAYRRTLNLSNDSIVNVTPESLTNSIQLSWTNNDLVTTDREWNAETIDYVSNTTGLYATANQFGNYLANLKTILNSRVAENEKRLQELESTYRVIKTSDRKDASTTLTITPSDVTSVETSEDYYSDSAPLETVPSEGVFRLRDTGFFSSIRSLGGFAGKAVLERSLGQIVTEGDLEAISDGSLSSHWMGTTYAPAPMRAVGSSVPWLPSKYKHGAAFIITYYLDRPTVASEVFIDPVTTEPFDLVTVTWTPATVKNILPDNGSWTGTDVWSYNGSAIKATTGGVGDSACLKVGDTVGSASYTFSLRTLFAPTVSGALQASGTIEEGSRLDCLYSIKGTGTIKGGVRLKWLDGSANVITQTTQEDFAPGFFTNRRLVDMIPVGAVSGTIEMGSFSTPDADSFIWIDDVKILVGEKRWDCGAIINQPTTIPLRESITADRFSFIFAQRNPRRETLSTQSNPVPINPIMGRADVDPTLQNLTQQLAEQYSSVGPGESIFAYRIGMKELDLRYREHVPRGRVVTLPIKANREIRRIWVTLEQNKFQSGNTRVYVYPFSNDTKNYVEVTPYISGTLDDAEFSLNQEGFPLNIYSTDEVDAGWNNPSDFQYTIKPQTMREVYDGTNIDGSIDLKWIPHLRLPKIHAMNSEPVNDSNMWGINAWLEKYSIYPTQFDPNASTLFGLVPEASGTVKAIRERNSTIPALKLSDIKSAQGYIPIKVTVKTEKWTAYPDTMGRPDRTKVRSVVGEELELTTVVSTTVDSSQQAISFDSWLNSETVGGLFTIGITDKTLEGQILSVNNSFAGRLKTLRSIYDPGSSQLKDMLLNEYTKLKASGKLLKDSSNTVTKTSATESSNSYKTKFGPIIPSRGLNSLKVYTGSGSGFLPLSPQDYQIDYGQGIITLLKAMPSNHSKVYASYQYISQGETESFGSSLIGLVTQEASGLVDISSTVGIDAPAFPLTRNMTDYLTGTIPKLRPPVFDRLSRDYYPVIEYYVNNSGKIFLARDFFKYGDIPAEITVEYETLGVFPRVSVELQRPGIPSSSPVIMSATINILEGGSSTYRGS